MAVETKNMVTKQFGDWCQSGRSSMENVGKSSIFLGFLASPSYEKPPLSGKSATFHTGKNGFPGRPKSRCYEIGIKNGFHWRCKMLHPVLWFAFFLTPYGSRVNAGMTPAVSLKVASGCVDTLDTREHKARKVSP